MIPLSCSNCWHNGLQYGSLGLSTGYCTRHGVLLNNADETTCGQQRRKDLAPARAAVEGDRHARAFESDNIVFLRARGTYRAPDTDGSDKEILRRDTTARVVTEYGSLATKIASLSSLRFVPGARAEMAMLSLGRAYTYNCMRRDGSWTSGIHILWWTRERLDQEPEVAPGDLRHSPSQSLARQTEITLWSVIMLRFLFLADVAHYALRDRHPISGLENLYEEAAEASGSLKPAKLLRWARSKGMAAVDRALPREEYQKLIEQFESRERAT